MANKIIRTIKEHGLIPGVIYGIDKISGKSALQDSVDTLYYYLNAIVDIKSFPVAQGCLRELQVCDVELLRLFDTVCDRHGLKYWIDFGTLLGAVRHKGFIPWDDDLDVSMPREDFELAFQILPEEMEKYGVAVEAFPNRPMAVFGFSYKHKSTGIWLDVFPADECYTSGGVSDAEKDLKNRVRKYRRYYEHNKNRKDKAAIEKAKQHFYLDKYSLSEDNTSLVIINDPEFDPNVILHNAHEVYPLSRIEFEGYSFSAPYDIDKYLKATYGDNYMGYPRTGVEHHGAMGVKLKDWAKNHDMDMSEVKDELKSIIEEYVKESISDKII